MHVDLGSGFKARGDRNFDIVKYPRVEICHLGFEEIPIESDTVDIVTAWDLLEHIPKVYNWKDENGWHTIYPYLFLIEEVYRILKVGGIWQINSPIVGQYPMFAPYNHITQLEPHSFNIFDLRQQHIMEVKKRRELDGIKAVFKILIQEVEIENVRFLWKLQKVLLLNKIARSAN